MQTIFDCFRFVQFICDKQRGGTPSPEEVSRAFDAAQNKLYGYYVPLKAQGDPDAYNALIPFIKSTSLTSTSAGLLAYPSDFGSVELIRGVYSYVKVLDSELQEALNSVLYPISTNPRYKEESSGIQLYPNETSTVTLEYLSKPTTPLVAVTVSGNTISYDAANSVQFQFSSQYWTDIIHLALPYVGVSLSAPEVASLGQLFNQGK